ncbi:keratin, type I cytoskeletal 13-like [Heterodontus francisci]|uniref:keratin, type I cytoskeletal 13-like n=1 Tax=Heterodontus francisci TaxID=7792 RepID=UPI00355BA643
MSMRSSRTSGSSISYSKSSHPVKYAQSAYSWSSKPAISVRSSSSRGFGGGYGGGYTSGFGGGYASSLGGGLGGGLSAGYASSFGGGYGGGSSSMLLGAGGLVTDEKNAMQNLNQRLATYLNNVQTLEKCNKDLEKEIREFTSNRTIEGFDWSVYDKTVKPLQQQILDAVLQNSRIALEIDNAKLAAKDFQSKWESELMLRQSVEDDICGLQQLKEEYLQLQPELVNDIAALEEEIVLLKKNHDEDLKMLQQHKTQDIQVEVDTAPSVDMGVVLQELRDNYNTMVQNNQKDLDKWYKEQVEIQITQTTQTNQALDGAKNELSQYRQQVQSLEADANALNGALIALQNTLNDTECRYDMELQGLLGKLSQLQAELGSIRNNITRQTQDYNNLVNIKMKLESEIHQYKCLLEGSGQSLIGVGSSSSGSSGVRSSGGSTTIITTTTTGRETQK